jgi:putative Holliday junction resolvase
MNILGVDYGRKMIGLAIAPLGVPVPLKPVRRNNMASAADEIAGIAGDYSVDAVVVGLPLNMDGSEGEIAREARNFAGMLKKKLRIPVELIDERLTSREAKRNIAISGTNAVKAKNIVHGVAACYILENYLEKRNAEKL